MASNDRAMDGSEVATESASADSRIDAAMLARALRRLCDAVRLHRHGRQREAVKVIGELDGQGRSSLPAWFWQSAEVLRAEALAAIDASDWTVP